MQNIKQVQNVNTGEKTPHKSKISNDKTYNLKENIFKDTSSKDKSPVFSNNLKEIRKVLSQGMSHEMINDKLPEIVAMKNIHTPHQTFVTEPIKKERSKKSFCCLPFLC